MPEHHRRATLEGMRTHLVRAESELEATQRFLDPKTGDETELDVVRDVANAMLCVSDALETLKLMVGEPGG
jgi:hypothetical protein